MATFEELRDPARLGFDPDALRAEYRHERDERFFAECTPGDYDNEGKPNRKTSITGNADGAGPVAFFEILAAWREEGALRELAGS